VRHIVNTHGRGPTKSVALSEGDLSFLGSLCSQGLAFGSIKHGDLEEYVKFIAAVVRSGLEQEGPEYLQTPGGQFWCWLGGLEPQVVWEQAVYLGFRRPEPEEAR